MQSRIAVAPASWPDPAGSPIEHLSQANQLLENAGSDCEQLVDLLTELVDLVAAEVAGDDGSVSVAAELRCRPSTPSASRSRMRCRLVTRGVVEALDVELRRATQQ